MPHQCVRCSTFYDDGAIDILNGCRCGGKLFFYIRKEKLEEARQVSEHLTQLTPDEKQQVEQDVLTIVRGEEDETPVVLDIEAIRVTQPGKFEIDLAHLFNKEHPLIFKLGEGKYVIDLAETFRRKGGVALETGSETGSKTKREGGRRKGKKK